MASGKDKDAIISKLKAQFQDDRRLINDLKGENGRLRLNLENFKSR
jgi:hypothetical protein